MTTNTKSVNDYRQALLDDSSSAFVANGEEYAALPSCSDYTSAQAALNVGGLVVVTTSFSTSKPLVIDDYTELYIPKGYTVTRAAGMNAPLVRNKYEGYLLNAADLSRTASATVIVADKNHTFSTGDKIIVGQCPTTAYNGVQTITVIDADHWSYTSGGSATDTGGGSTYYATIIPVRETVAAANVSGASNFVTVNTALASAKLKPGDNVWVGSDATDTNFVGEKIVASVIPGVSFTYYSASASGNPTGNLLLSFNVGIKISGGGKLDGNAANQTAPGTANTLGMRCNTVSMAMVSRFTVADGTKITGAIYRAIGCFNCAKVDLDFYADDTLVGAQFEGDAHNILIRKARGESVRWNSTYSKYQNDDFIAFTGTHYIGNAGYDNTTSPYGLGNFDFDLWDVDPDNCKNGVKITGYSSVHFKGRIRKVNGGAKNPVLISGTNGATVGLNAGVCIMDDTAALTGAIVDFLEIGEVNVHDAYASAAVKSVYINNSGANGTISIGYIDDGADIASLVQVDQNTGSTQELVLPHQRQTYDMATSTKPRYLFNSGTVKSIRYEDAVLIPPTTGGAPTISLKSGFVYGELVLNGQYGGNADHSGVLINHAAAPAKIVFDDFIPGATAYGVSQTIYYPNTSAGTLNVYATNTEISSNSFITDGGINIGAATFNYYFSGFKWTPGGNNLIQCNASASVHNVYGGANNVLPNQLFITGSGSQVINFYTESARLDITNNARLGKPMGAKAWNTNSALGTLAAAGPVISDGTNWHAQWDTSKTY